jgi:hypothetical protein
MYQLTEQHLRNGEVSTSELKDLMKLYNAFDDDQYIALIIIKSAIAAKLLKIISKSAPNERIE